LAEKRIGRVGYPSVSTIRQTFNGSALHVNVMDEYFERGYHIDRYHALEEDLLTFLNYITIEFYPKPKNQKYIKSIYLADLMLRIGSNIGIFFDKFIESYAIKGEMHLQQNLFTLEQSAKTVAELKATKAKNLSNPKWQGWNWGDYKKLDPILSLSDQHVVLIPLDEMIYPFRYNGLREGKSWTDINKVDAGFWWNSYNKIKHNAAFKGANLNITLQSLAALFLLVTRSGFGDTKKLQLYDYEKEASFMGTVTHDISSRLFSKGIIQMTLV